MGCVISNQSDTPLRFAYFSAKYVSRKWRVVPTEDEAKVAFSAEGTLSVSSSTLQVELRTLLDYPLAIKSLSNFISDSAPGSQAVLDGWCEIQNYNSLPDVYDISYRIELALTIQEKYTRDYMDEAEQADISCHIAKGDHISLKGLFKGLQTRLFEKLHQDVFLPFRQGAEYKRMNNALRQKFNSVLCSDFEYFDILGEGGFGMVCSVRKKSTGSWYAMKLQRKDKIFAMCEDEPWRADFEKTLFASCKHPFIVELFFAFQTKSLAMLVMSLGTGKDLSKVCKVCGPLTYEHVVFYSAEITSALSYLHHKGFIYRDLKPGNVLLNADGHIQLIDFGAVCDVKGNNLSACNDPVAEAAVLARQASRPGRQLPLSEQWSQTHGDSAASVSILQNSHASSAMATLRTVDMGAPTASPQPSSSRKRARSLIGTLGYMAPEMVLLLLQHDGWESKGYTKAVDWWSLGVTMYKLLTGRAPFDTDFRDAPEDANTETVLKIGFARYGALFEEVDYNPLRGHPDVVSCVSALLTPEETGRLGYGDDGSLKVATHSYFSRIDWVQLEQKLVSPPPLPLEIEPPAEKPPSYIGAEHMLAKEGKADWMKIGCRDEHGPDRALVKEIQAQFEGWDYASTEAVAAELRAIVPAECESSL